MGYLASSAEYTTLTGQTLSASSYPTSTAFDTLNDTFSYTLNQTLGRTSNYTTAQQLSIAKNIVARWIYNLGKIEKADLVYRSPALAAQNFALQQDPIIDTWIKLLQQYEFTQNYSSYVR